MTREERLRATSAAWSEVEAQLRREGNDRLAAFVCLCTQAIAGAAMWLDRDPTQLAEMLRGGEIADLIRQAEQSMGLPFSTPQPQEEVRERLLAAADWADAERQRIERQLRRVSKELSTLSEDLREREHWSAHWQEQWPISREKWMPWLQSDHRDGNGASPDAE